jgi:uncharacterized protein YjaG (DUF416 family)
MTDSASTKLDQVIDELSSELRKLDPRQQTAFFAACGEGLLPLYAQFSKTFNWGDEILLRLALDAAWRYVEQGSKLDADDLLARIESVTPHTDDFETPASIYAQDAVVCIDSAIRTALGEAVSPECVEFALEPVKVSLCLRQRGLVAIGDSAEDLQWLSRAVNEPEFARAVAFCRGALAQIAAARKVESKDLAQLCSGASALRPL